MWNFELVARCNQFQDNGGFQDDSGLTRTTPIDLATRDHRNPEDHRPVEVVGKDDTKDSVKGDQNDEKSYIALTQLNGIKVFITNYFD